MPETKYIGYIFDYLLTVIVKMQSVDRKTSFMFVGGMNIYHKEWLGSSTTNLRVRTARDCLFIEL